MKRCLQEDVDKPDFTALTAVISTRSVIAVVSAVLAQCSRSSTPNLPAKIIPTKVA